MRGRKWIGHQGIGQRCGHALTSRIRGGRPSTTRLDLAGNLLLRSDGPACQVAECAVEIHRREQGRGGHRAFLQLRLLVSDYQNDGWPAIMVMPYDIQDAGDIAADPLGLPSRPSGPACTGTTAMALSPT